MLAKTAFQSCVRATDVVARKKAYDAVCANLRPASSVGAPPSNGTENRTRSVVGPAQVETTVGPMPVGDSQARESQIGIGSFPIAATGEVAVELKVWGRCVLGQHFLPKKLRTESDFLAGEASDRTPDERVDRQRVAFSSHFHSEPVRILCAQCESKSR